MYTDSIDKFIYSFKYEFSYIISFSVNLYFKKSLDDF